MCGIVIQQLQITPGSAVLTSGLSFYREIEKADI
jgi:hypothetical protein